MHPTATSIRLGAATGFASAHAALWLTAPHLGVVIALVEVALTIAVIFTALYAPRESSDRAFRLLPWVTADPQLHTQGQTDRRCGVSANKKHLVITPANRTHDSPKSASASEILTLWRADVDLTATVRILHGSR